MALLRSAATLSAAFFVVESADVVGRASPGSQSVLRLSAKNPAAQTRMTSPSSSHMRLEVTRSPRQRFLQAFEGPHLQAKF